MGDEKTFKFFKVRTNSYFPDMEDLIWEDESQPLDAEHRFVVIMTEKLYDLLCRSLADLD